MLTYALRVGENPISVRYSTMADVRAAGDDVERLFTLTTIEDFLPDKGEVCTNGYQHGVLVNIERDNETFGKVYLWCEGKDHYTPAPTRFCEKHLEDLGFLEPIVRQEVCRAMLKGRQNRAEDKIEGQLDRVEKILSDACKGASHRFFASHATLHFRRNAFHRLDIAHQSFRTAINDADEAIQRIHGAYLHYTDIEDLDGHLPMEMLVRDIMDDLHEIVLEVKSFVLPKDKRKHDLL